MRNRTTGVFRRQRTAITALAVLTSAALALTACGGNSDDSGGGSGSGGGGGSSGTINIGGTVSLTSPAASFPEVKQAQDAAVASINAAGGVNGKQLKLTVCDGKFEVNAELGCFRSLLRDKVSAIVGPVLIAGTGVSEYKAAEQAKTAVIGSPAYQPGELVSSAAFPLGPSVVGGTYGAIYDLLKNGAKNISVFGDANNPAANSIVQLSKQALSSINKSPVNVVVGDTSTDPTLQSAAAKAIGGGTDGIIITGAPPSMAKSVPALRAQGYKGLIATIDGALPAPVVTAIAPVADGMLVASQTAFPEQAPASSEFLADMKKYAPDAPLSFFSIQAWSSIKLFAAVATQAKATSNEEVLNAFQNLSTAVDIKTLAPYKVAGVTSPITDGFEPAPRMFNQQVQLGTMRGGKFVASGGFVDPFAALKTLG